MPCADVYASDTDSVTLEIFEQNHSHSSDVDLCSPFCFCNCCQVLAQPTVYYTIQVDLVGFNLTIPPLVQNDVECTFAFWRPPQV